MSESQHQGPKVGARRTRGVRRAVWLGLLGSALAHAAPPDTPTPSAVTAAHSGAVTAAHSGASGIRRSVFFSGHSLVDNPLPDWVELIATSRGDTLGWEEQIVLGSPIRVRTKGNDPNAPGYPGYQLGKGKNGGIDVLRELKNPTALAGTAKYGSLVITERNDLLGTIRWEDTLGHLRHFHDRLVEQNPQASTLLYQCWPDLDKAKVEAWLAYVEQELFVWECAAARLNQTLAAEGRSDRIEVVPGGRALSELVKRALAGEIPGVTGTPERRLAAIFSDEVHLNPPGVYLLSALHYAALFGKTPVGAAAPKEVSPALVPLLQQLAWSTQQSYRARAATPPTLAECSSRTAKDICPAYYRLRGEPEKINQCKSWSASDGPFAADAPAGTAEPKPRRALALVGGSGLAALIGSLGYYWKRRRARG